MKRCIVLLFICLMLLLFGCSKSGELLPQASADDRFTEIYADIVETDDVLFFHRANVPKKLLYYYDKQTGESDVFCANPECLHNDAGCSADLGISQCQSLSYYEGRIWFPDFSAGRVKVFSIDIDSGKRKLECETTMPLCAPQRAAINGGKLYVCCGQNAIQNGMPAYQFQVLAIDLQKSETRVVFDKIIEASSGFPTVFMRFEGDSVFFCLSTGADPFCEIYKWNDGMEEPELIFEDKSEIIPIGFSVTQNEELYIVARGLRFKGYKLFSVKSGETTPIFDFNSETATYGRPTLAKDVVICRGRNAEGKAIFSVWALDGSSVVEEAPFAATVDPDFKFMIGGTGGDKNAVYFLLSEDVEAEGKFSEEPETEINMLLGEFITENGVEERIVCRETK